VPELPTLSPPSAKFAPPVLSAFADPASSFHIANPRISKALSIELPWSPVDIKREEVLSDAIGIGEECSSKLDEDNFHQRILGAADEAAFETGETVLPTIQELEEEEEQLQPRSPPSFQIHKQQEEAASSDGIDQPILVEYPGVLRAIPEGTPDVVDCGEEELIASRNDALDPSTSPESHTPLEVDPTPQLESHIPASPPVAASAGLVDDFGFIFPAMSPPTSPRPEVSPAEMEAPDVQSSTNDFERTPSQEAIPATEANIADDVTMPDVVTDEPLQLSPPRLTEGLSTRPQARINTEASKSVVDILPTSKWSGSTALARLVMSRGLKTTAPPQASSHTPPQNPHPQPQNLALTTTPASAPVPNGSGVTAPIEVSRRVDFRDECPLRPPDFVTSFTDDDRRVIRVVASNAILQNRPLYRALSKSGIELVDRPLRYQPQPFTTLEPHVILDPKTCVLFRSLPALVGRCFRAEELDPAFEFQREEAVFTTLYRLIQDFDRVLLVFEVGPESASLTPFTPPVCAALKLLAETISAYLAGVDAPLVIDIGVAFDPKEAASIARKLLCQLQREDARSTAPLPIDLWHDRSWLDAVPSPVQFPFSSFSLGLS
jgi:hypothetical protein